MENTTRGRRSDLSLDEAGDHELPDPQKYKGKRDEGPEYEGQLEPYGEGLRRADEDRLAYGRHQKVNGPAGKEPADGGYDCNYNERVYYDPPEFLQVLQEGHFFLL